MPCKEGQRSQFRDPLWLFYRGAQQPETFITKKALWRSQKDTHGNFWFVFIRDCQSSESFAMPPSPQTSDFDSDSSRISEASIATLDYNIETPRLRGLRWRTLLSVLPPYPAPIESLRRAAANGRRRYAELRRRLIVDPHAMDDYLQRENLSIDNPLSQDPESIWGRYFRNTEIEKLIENDLTRLYPEHGSFFQSFSCQAMLKRVLLVWALIHPDYGYRQGMHEVLAPLVYVLHVDVIYLAQAKQRYEDPFEDRFDTPFGKCSHRKQAMASFSVHSAFLSSKEGTLVDNEDSIERVHPEDLHFLGPDDFGFNLKSIVLGSDSYGAEGELGALLSGRFLEHDAYCMFDALMERKGGAVKLTDYFMAVKEATSRTGVSPVIEASNAIYQALGMVDIPLYIHLVGLGIEPQFFALRWLRVLFGREFELDKLLVLWDAIFSMSNKLVKKERIQSSNELMSPGGSFIYSFAVSMLIYLRPALLASSNATSCLQKLLNFPKNVDIRSLVENAKVLQSFSKEQVVTFPSPSSKFVHPSRGQKYRSGSRSPPFQSHIPPASSVLHQRHMGSTHDIMRSSLPESYWEDKWINSVLSKGVTDDIQGLQSSEKDTASITSSGNKTSRSDTCGDTLTREDDLAGDFPGLLEGFPIKETGSVSSSENLPSSPIAAGEHQFIDSVNELMHHSGYDGEVIMAEGNSYKGEGRHQEELNDRPLPVSTSASRGISKESGVKAIEILEVSDSNSLLQTLGQSMLGSIQILENVVIQHTASSESLPKALLNEKGHDLALAAIAELRKISNILLQM